MALIDRRSRDVVLTSASWFSAIVFLLTLKPVVYGMSRAGSSSAKELRGMVLFLDARVMGSTVTGEVVTDGFWRDNDKQPSRRALVSDGDVCARCWHILDERVDRIGG